MSAMCTNTVMCSGDGDTLQGSFAETPEVGCDERATSYIWGVIQSQYPISIEWVSFH